MQRLRFSTIVSCGLLVAAQAAAHDFWMAPGEYSIAPRGFVEIAFQVGDHGAAQRSQLPRSRIVRFATVGPRGASLDLREHLREPAAAYDARLQIDAPGTHLIVLESDNRARSDLPADVFNAYIDDEGLTLAQEHRQRANRMSEPASERYSRCAKVLVQVGADDALSSQHVTTPVGLPLEIVLLSNPYSERAGERLPVRVIYRNRALGGALVKVTDLEAGSVVERRRTNAAGDLEVQWPRSGRWMLSVVWSEPLASHEEVEFETVFSTLSFGFAERVSLAIDVP